MRRWRVLGFRATLALAVSAPTALGAAALASTGAGATTRATAAATTSISASVGNDISFPQCGSPFPSGQAFGIVGINDGLPNTLDPCLGPPSATSPATSSATPPSATPPPSSTPSYSKSELYWAVSTSSGSGAEPKASVYVNTADPGNVVTGTLVADWPTSGSTPYGTCTTTTVTTSSGPKTAGQDSPACAWEYGNEKAAQDVSWLVAAAQAINAQSPPVAVPATASGYPWWLDVEIANTWQTGASGQKTNVAVLQGIVVGLTAAGAPSVGVYSTSYMWGVITGGTSASTPSIGRLTTWIPGAANEAGALTTCAGPSFTAGPVGLAQFPSGSFDGDLPCTQPTDARIYGQTPDATAAAEFTRAFHYAKSACPASRAAVLATTREYQDALSSQFLAQYLTTGTLLTPTTSLSQVTATTLREEGIDTVYIVGGPLAVSATVQSAIEAMTAYECGGKTRATAEGKIVVHRLFGQTQYATAMSVVDFVGKAASAAFPGAYSTTNSTGGTGRYNDTAGAGSPSPPAASEPTAILANGQEFQDAQAASVISYRAKFPMLLTPATTLSATAVSAIQHLGIQQVILLGGPLAVTDGVEAQLVAETGVSVLRVAGKDYTDTARELARFEAAGPTEGLGWTSAHRIMVARGNGFTDGLCGGVLENVHNVTTGIAGTARPLLLTETPTLVGTYLSTFLAVTGHTGIDGTTGKTIIGLVILGGPLAVTTATVTAMQADLSR
ncbi:MAG: cell wall-binding repeat-containing protein [Actinomycetota bacterium]|nr:cell wall-binding repeat-containing protein [Actinomycetota bacterium]